MCIESDHERYSTDLVGKAWFLEDQSTTVKNMILIRPSISLCSHSPTLQQVGLTVALAIPLGLFGLLASDQREKGPWATPPKFPA